MPDLDVISVVRDVAGHLRPMLHDPQRLDDTSRVTAVKEGDHIAQEIDSVAERLLFEAVRREGYDGTVFSEEAGVTRFGSSSRLLVSDPYCNTNLTFRGVRESSITLYEFDDESQFVGGCIADLQIARCIAFRPMSATVIWETGREGLARTSDVVDPALATVVLSAMKPSRRAYLALPVAELVGTLLVVDGGIVALRIACGEVDGFVDHERGQPAYEAIAYRAVEAAGGVVTDGRGHPIDWSGLARGLAAGATGRQTVVAAATEDLHARLLAALAP